MKNESINKKYFDITVLIQNEFDRNAVKYGEKMKCRKGCSMCCSQIFRITMLDAEVIGLHIKNLSPVKRKVLRDKAKIYIKNKEKSLNESDEFFASPKLPCPALDDTGSCMIYEARPVICRRFGPPVYDYKNPEKLYACKLNFKEGEEIIDDKLIPNQTDIGIKWDELKTLYNQENSLKKNASTTIAEAILKN